MSAKILSYSRSRGVFAGLELEGATLHQDNDANKALYTKQIDAADILGGKVKTPAAAQPVIDVLAKYSPKGVGAASGTAATDAGAASPAAEAPTSPPAAEAAGAVAQTTPPATDAGTASPAAPPTAEAAGSAPAAEKTSTSVWLWVTGLLIVAIVGYYVIRSRRSA
jgi:hypothetical protein